MLVITDNLHCSPSHIDTNIDIVFSRTCLLIYLIISLSYITGALSQTVHLVVSVGERITVNYVQQPRNDL